MEKMLRIHSKTLTPFPEKFQDPIPWFGLDKVATRSYYHIMEIIKSVGVKTLKNQLSAYLRDVKNGVHVLVTDRDLVIAELRQPSLGSIAAGRINPVLADWVTEGKARLPLTAKSPLPKIPDFSIPAGTAKRLIDEDRGS